MYLEKRTVIIFYNGTFLIMYVCMYVCYSHHIIVDVVTQIEVVLLECYKVPYFVMFI
jgi:hypothetical protein